ncbi:MAG: RHS repeat protein, partial [Bacteroidetes bacterium]|nr:RHS repeat protein [Bacteroidota bacterium]
MFHESRTGYSASYTYDAGGRLDELTNRFSEVTEFAYDTLGRVSTKTLDSGTYASYSYDDRGRLTSLVHKKGDNSTISSESYVFNDASR